MLSNVDSPPIFHLLPLPTMVILVENDVLKIKDINPAYADMLDCSEEEVKGKTLEELFVHTYLPSPGNILQSVKRVIDTGKRDKYTDTPHIKGQSQDNWLWQVEHIPQRDEAKNMEVVQILQKQNSKDNWALGTGLPKTSGNPFSMWEEGLKLSKTGTWELDLNTKRLFWSPTVKEIHGVSISYQPELDSAVHFYKEGVSRKVINRALELARENGQPFDVELQIITAKGEQKWIRATGKAELQNGVVSRIYGAVQDIDDSKRSLMNMLAEKIKYETLLQSINAIVYEANADTMSLTFVSGQVECLLGYQPANLTNRGGFWTDYATEDSPLKLTESYMSLAKRDPAFEMKYSIRNTKGETVIIQDHVTVIRKNNHTYYRGFITLRE